MSSFIGEAVAQSVGRMLLAVVLACLLIGAVCGGGAVAVWNWRSQPTPVEDCCCISLEDALAEYYHTRHDWEDHRVKVNGQEPAEFGVLVCEGDDIAVALKHPLIRPDGTKHYLTNAWTVKRPGGGK
jgi:hypothetical protein